ncbi:hypothetical protein LX76_03999 [Cereibacter changlensis]|uniref:Uncharacterized protein n=1 Tax=Cereibacter changlensis TaxID=402884 RepID=A0A2W7QKZ5_9RHOB|nr:hypothetical protein LX76_03999 [Cereibacter changlensis]
MAAPARSRPAGRWRPWPEPASGRRGRSRPGRPDQLTFATGQLRPRGAPTEGRRPAPMPWRGGVLPARAGIAASGSRAAIASAGAETEPSGLRSPSASLLSPGFAGRMQLRNSTTSGSSSPRPWASLPITRQARWPCAAGGFLTDPQRAEGMLCRTRSIDNGPTVPAPRPPPCAGGWASPRSGRAADPASPRRDVGFLIRLDGFYETVRQFPHCLNDISRSPATRGRAIRQHRQSRHIGYIPVRYKNSCFPHLTWRAIARLHAVGNRALWEGGGSFSSSFQRHPGLSSGEGACPAHGAGRPPVAAPDGSKRGRRVSWLHLKRCSMCAGNP